MDKYIHYGSTSFDNERFIPVENRNGFPKPNGGFWASNENAIFGWKEWNDSEHFMECQVENSFIFTLSDNANVLRINSCNQLKELPKVENDWGIFTWIVLDFEKLSETYDAIEVNISSDYRLYQKLYAWDCDSILIMNPEVIIGLNNI